MKKADKQKLHQMTVADLQKRVAELEIEINGKQLEKKAFKLKDVKSVAKLKDELAIVKTILTQKAQS